MKTLYLLRHAKSSWDDPSLSDFDRPLAPRGRRAAPKMGREFEKRKIVPDLVVCSPAVRARQTLERFAEGAGLRGKAEYEERIYGASSSELMALVRGLPDTAKSALLVGHNPGFEDLLSRLVGTSEAFPTATLACIELQAESWTDVEDDRGSLKWLLRPKELG